MTRPPAEGAHTGALARALATLAEQTSADDVLLALPAIAARFAEASGAVTMLSVGDALRVTGVAEPVSCDVGDVVSASQTVTEALATTRRLLVADTDPLLGWLPPPAWVVPLMCRDRPVAVLGLGGLGVVPPETAAGLTVLGHYAGLEIAHFWDAEVREDLLRVRGEAITALRRIADTDPLTGVGNRARLYSVLNSLLSRRERVGIVYVDLDGFKAINDRLGHDTGDAVLVATARRLQAAMRPTDVVTRIGGDEFVLVVPKSNITGLNHLVHRLTTSLTQPVVIAGETVRLDASYGVAVADPSVSAADLIKAADRAMYEHKHDDGPGGHRIISLPRN